MPEPIVFNPTKVTSDQKDKSASTSFIFASLATTCMHVLSHPLNVIQTRLQVAPILKTLEDWSKAIFLNAHGKSIPCKFSSITTGFVTSGIYKITNPDNPNFKEQAVAATFASGINVLATNPLTLVRTRVQTEINYRPPSVHFTELFATRGIKGVYQGAGLNFFKNTSGKMLPLLLTGLLTKQYSDLQRARRQAHEIADQQLKVRKRR